MKKAYIKESKINKGLWLFVDKEGISVSSIKDILGIEPDEEGNVAWAIKEDEVKPIYLACKRYLSLIKKKK